MTARNFERAPYGKKAAAELEKYFEQSSLQRIQQEQEIEMMIADLRTVNAERRLRDQRDLDADYRNYIVPV
jgi:hypothetical protein